MTARTITPAEANRRVAAGQALIIDVRSPEEFRAEHIATALSVPLDRLSQTLDSLATPGQRSLIFQCQKGTRGATACALAEKDRPDATNLEGGIEAWKAAGLPVISAGRSGVIPLVRQVQIAVGGLVLAFVIAGFLITPAFFVLAGLVGTMLAVAGLTGWCGMALLLQRMPWNRPAAG